MMSSATAILFIAAVAACFAALQPKDADASGDLIQGLPGLPSSFTSKQYSGYVTVDAKSNRNLFYWFVESGNNPATDPVVLWLNGGMLRNWCIESS